MKTRAYFTAVILFALCFSVNSQNLLPDYLIIEKNFPGKSDLEKSMKDSENVFFNNTSSPVFTQISSIIEGKGINNLHLFIQTESGKMIFEGIILTNTNISGFAEHLSTWKNSVKGRVIIHSNVIFNNTEGDELKQKLESITGLPFEIRNIRNN